MVYHIDWLANVKPSLNLWNKSHSIILYDPFNVLLCLVCWYFKDFCICVHQRYCPIIFFLCVLFVWFWYQGDVSFINELESIPFSSGFFWNNMRRMGIKSSLNVWWNSPVKPSSPEYFGGGASYSITVSISVLVVSVVNIFYHFIIQSWKVVWF